MPAPDTTFDLRFYQAAATVMPTLLVALAITGRSLQKWARTRGESLRQDGRSGTRWRWLCLLCVVGLPVLGERAALTVLARGEDSVADR